MEAKKIVLDNGATVYYKKSLDNNSSTMMNAVSEGGFSMYDNQMYKASMLLNEFSSAFDVPGYDYSDIEPLMNNGYLVESLFLEETNEKYGFHAHSSCLDLMFEKMYRTFEDYKFLDRMFDIIKEGLISDREMATQYNADNYRVLVDNAMDSLIYGDRPPRINKQDIQNVTKEQLKQIYKERFSNASDWTFYIVSSEPYDRIKELCTTYIGAMNSTGEKENYREIPSQFKKGYTQKILKLEMENKTGGNLLLLNKEIAISEKEAFAFQIISNMMDEEVYKYMRETLNGTYVTRLNHYYVNKPVKSCGFNINFQCAPEKTEALSDLLKQKLNAMAMSGLDEAKFDIVKANIQLDPPVRNDVWAMSVMEKYFGEGIDQSNPSVHIKMVEDIDFQYTNQLFKRFFNKCNIIDILYMPKKY